MRYIRRHHLADLAKIAEGINIIAGNPPNPTDTLYFYFDTGVRFPVKTDGGEIIGHWQYIEEIEDIVFIPVKY